MRTTFLLACFAALASVSNATILSVSSGDAVVGNHGTNLITNGSFEADNGNFANNSYWATGTSLNPTMSLTGWNAGGLANSYANWGNDGNGRKSGSDTLTDGANALYFGASIMMPLSSYPVFATNGEVSFPSAPNITSKPGFGPVTLSQTLTGLNTSSSYTLDFWASGEFAGTNPFPGGDGFFGLDITGESQMFLAAPSGNSNLLATQRYYIQFKPNFSTVTLTWTNWGHYLNQSGALSTELVLDDVILNADVVPEPCTLVLLGIGTLGLLRNRKRGKTAS